jgi:hypothetical protein
LCQRLPISVEKAARRMPQITRRLSREQIYPFYSIDWQPPKRTASSCRMGRRPRRKTVAKSYAKLKESTSQDAPSFNSPNTASRRKVRMQICEVNPILIRPAQFLIQRILCRSEQLPPAGAGAMSPAIKTQTSQTWKGTR